jgi:7-keto-8-aminopelargonate synthetase-like enzyme
MTKVEQLEARIKSLNDQAEMVIAKIGLGPHADALLAGTRMMIEEIEEKLAQLKAGDVE